jgi:GNAT superfamily N-acetyltransferase
LDKKLAEGLAFQKAKPSAEKHLESLYRAAFEAYVRSLRSGRDESSYGWLPGSISDGNIWVAIHESDMIGAVTLVAESDNWQIEEVVVSPGLQGRGVGSWMLEKLEVQHTIKGSRN